MTLKLFPPKSRSKLLVNPKALSPKNTYGKFLLYTSLNGFGLERFSLFSSSNFQSDDSFSIVESHSFPYTPTSMYVKR